MARPEAVEIRPLLEVGTSPEGPEDSQTCGREI